MFVKFGSEHYEFNFSKFSRQRHDRELPKEDLIIENIASIDVPFDNPLRQIMEEHENDMYMQERNELEDIFLDQPTIIKHNLPMESLGLPTPPKGDLVFDLKVLPDTLQYAYLDEKKIYHVIINSDLSEQEAIKSKDERSGEK